MDILKFYSYDPLSSLLFSHWWSPSTRKTTPFHFIHSHWNIQIEPNSTRNYSYCSFILLNSAIFIIKFKMLMLMSLGLIPFFCGSDPAHNCCYKPPVLKHIPSITWFPNYVMSLLLWLQLCCILHFQSIHYLSLVTQKYIGKKYNLVRLGIECSKTWF